MIPPSSHHLTLPPDSVETELKLLMTDNALSFDELPGAVQSLTSLVKDLAKEVIELRKQIRILSGEPSKSVEFVGIAVFAEMFLLKSRKFSLLFLTFLPFCRYE